MIVAFSMIAAATLAGAPAERSVTLRPGTPVPLATVDALSSRTHAKGDIVWLRTVGDVVVDGVVAVPGGTAATGQIAESRGTGGMGTQGHLAIRPLYLRIGDRTVRLVGAAKDTGRTKADTVLGMALLTPLLSGRAASLPSGTRIEAVVEKAVVIGHLEEER